MMVIFVGAGTSHWSGRPTPPPTLLGLRDDLGVAKETKDRSTLLSSGLDSGKHDLCERACELVDECQSASSHLKMFLDANYISPLG